MCRVYSEVQVTMSSCSMKMSTDKNAGNVPKVKRKESGVQYNREVGMGDSRRK